MAFILNNDTMACDFGNKDCQKLCLSSSRDEKIKGVVSFFVSKI